MNYAQWRLYLAARLFNNARLECACAPVGPAYLRAAEKRARAERIYDDARARCGTVEPSAVRAWGLDGVSTSDILGQPLRVRIRYTLL